MDQQLFPFMDGLTCLPEELPAKTSASPDGAPGGGQGSGTRSSLCWEWLRLVSELAPRVVLWENVPGCLSTHNGADFSRLVAALGDLGYGCSWRVLDCQYSRVDVWPMAIPQRRRRVWLVGVADADVDGAAEILFEPSCLLGRAKPERASGAALAACAGGRPAGSSGTIRVRSGCPGGGKGALVSEEQSLVLATGNDQSVYNFELTTNGVQMSACRAGDNIVYPRGRAMSGEVTGTLTGNHESRITDASNVVVGFMPFAGAKGSAREGDDVAPCFDLHTQDAGVGVPSCVRRLTPEECEALMGYPIGYTKVPYRGKPAEACPDGPRYEACGNGWAINSARWILLGVQKFLGKSAAPGKVLPRTSRAIQGRKRDKRV